MVCCMIILGLFIQAVHSISPREKVMQQERQELEELQKRIKTDDLFKDLFLNFSQSWEESNSLPHKKLTERQWEWFHNLSLPLDENGELAEPEDDDDVSTTTDPIRDVVRKKLRGKLVRIRDWIDDVLSRPKRQGSCDTIPKAKRNRKEWRVLKPSQRQKYINALGSLDTFIPDPVGDPGTSAFDLFVLMHRFASAPGAHAGASFLGWHREYLWRFAAAMWEQGYTQAMPLIDSALDQTLPNPMDSALFSTTFHGVGTHSGVLAGPWNASISVPIAVCGSSVTRSVPPAADAKSFAYSRAKYDIILNKSCFRDLTIGWDFNMEGFHNVGHLFFGGTMNNVACSPSDPVFWMHHANVDCLWEEFREAQQDSSNRTREYPLTDIGNTPSEMAWDSDMKPFHDRGYINVHGLSNHYRNYYYTCLQRPSRIFCSATTDCVSSTTDPNPMLWCEVNTQRCHAKIRVRATYSTSAKEVGGECLPSWPDEQCWCLSGTPVCAGTTCVCT